MSTNYDQMEEIWGKGATYSEYQIDDRICYTLEGQMYTGTIIWVCAPTSGSTGNGIAVRDLRWYPVEVREGERVWHNPRKSPCGH